MYESLKNNSKTVKNEHDKEVLKEIYISQRKTENYWGSKINIIGEQWNIHIYIYTYKT